MKQDSRLDLRIPTHTKEQAAKVAAQQQESLSGMVRRMLAKAIAEAEARAEAEQAGQAVGAAWTAKQKGKAA